MAGDKGRKIVVIRKKKIVAGGHHGGSWKVAYADFVTAMMAFFMVMWILGMDDSVKQAVEGYFSNPVGYKKGYGAGTSPIASGASPAHAGSTQVRLLVRAAEGRRMASLAQKVERAVASDPTLKRLGAKVEVKVARDGLRIELVESGAGDVYFPVGSATMKPAAVVALQLITPALGATANPVIVEGHTDAARFGTSAAYGNWELSGERANAARRVMEAAGLPTTRVAGVRGYADREPRVAGDPYAPANRRITVFLPYLSPSPDAAAEAGPGGAVGTAHEVALGRSRTP